jgi:hypothetical protein
METSWCVKICAGEVDFDEEMILMEGEWRAYICVGALIKIEYLHKNIPIELNPAWRVRTGHAVAANLVSGDGG